MSETIKANSTPMNLQPLINDDEDIQVESLPPVPPRPHRRRRWLIALVVIVILALLGGGGMFFYMQKTSTPPVQYTQQAATVGNISLTVSASGPISANAEYDMNFNVAGQVSAINVQVGQQVKAGQTLATLKSTSLQDAVTQAQQSVANAQTTYNDAVNNGASQTVLDTDNNNVLTAQGQLKTAQDNLAATILTAPANATVASINGKVGQSAGASGGSTSSSTTPFIVLIDTSASDINALVNEADIGNVHVGQPAQFTVAAYPSQTFRASVTSVDLIGQTSGNVVVYPVHLRVDQHSLNGTYLYPGMTATTTITTAERIGALLVSNAALSFPNTAVQAGAISRSTLFSAFSGSSTARGTQSNSNQRIVLELKNGKLVPVVITTGLTNGTNTEVLSGLQPGDQVVVRATGGNFSNLSGNQTSPGGNFTRPGIRSFGGGG
ncbi:MAG: HlyD family efflux transporter periplasmic adaptor subunit [Chloroflexi bacterium]|nr:MAG: HlyD family efflux transporter periplasmic adaptor subunit [Chloroflexota bacterium]